MCVRTTEIKETSYSRFCRLFEITRTSQTADGNV